jgi:DNA polymerase-1
VGELLFGKLGLPVQSKTKTGPSTDASVLEALSGMHEIPRLLLEYREISKLLGTYVEPLPEMIDPKTGRIHASFHLTGTATGRLSSSDPNLQNIPVRSERGMKIRSAFVPEKGKIFLSADYSQIELRILAHLSGDEELIRSFHVGEDVHRRTAAETLGKPLDEVTDRDRSIAKAINFGLMYGKTAFGLAQELGIPRGEAKAFIDRYFTRYRGVKQYLDSLIESVRETGLTMTMLGRKRKLPEIRSQNAAVRANAERMAMNTPIQGSAADLIKIAMARLDEELRSSGSGARLLLQVHDELVLECPLGELDTARALLIRTMEGAFKLQVPLVVNVSTGMSWAEL